jgi:chorismate mutase
MAVRGIRGAITTDQDINVKIRESTKLLLEEIVKVNPNLHPDDIASIIFTVSHDLSSEYPAHAAREFGWTQVPLLCAQEIPVPGGLEHCIRVLILWNTELPQSNIHHVYLKEAQKLRPDLKENQ